MMEAALVRYLLMRSAPAGAGADGERRLRLIRLQPLKMMKVSRVKQKLYFTGIQCNLIGRRENLYPWADVQSGTAIVGDLAE